MLPNHFDGAAAANYDAGLGPMGEAAALAPVVDLLAELAGDRAALELAIGTGRVALPLCERGVAVHGIELSPAMVDQLRTKPGGGAVDVTIGDMATTRVVGEFGVVYLVFNTIMNLTTQAAQVACFANAADHLAPGGSFVVEVAVPDLRLLAPGQRVVPFDVSAEHVGFDEYTDLTHAQQMTSHHVNQRGDRLTRHAVPFRYVWPAELDLMAQLAGLHLSDRWATWTREPFTNDSRAHISVWTKPA